MGCCGGGPPIDGIYVPLNKRLINYGREQYGEQLLEKFKKTHIWLFTFYDDKNIRGCQECGSKLSEMGSWFAKYGLFDNLIKNVKWVIDDNVSNNMILKDMNVTKTPVHFFCDEQGKIIDIVYGFPTPDWLEKHILPLVT